MLSVNRK